MKLTPLLYNAAYLGLSFVSPVNHHTYCLPPLLKALEESTQIITSQSTCASSDDSYMIITK
jgi:hypothetical protein